MKKKKPKLKMKLGRHTLEGSHATTAKKIQKVMAKMVVGHTILCVDPASRSLGWAIFRLTLKGWVMDNSGVFVAKGDINKRLNELSNELDFLIDPDAVFVEFIGASGGHKYLVWSVGMIATTFPHCPLVEVQTGLWKKFAGKDWTKGDREDAEAIGKCVLEIANEK